MTDNPTDVERFRTVLTDMINDCERRGWYPPGMAFMRSFSSSLPDLVHSQKDTQRIDKLQALTPIASRSHDWGGILITTDGETWWAGRGEGGFDGYAEGEGKSLREAIDSVPPPLVKSEEG